MVLLDMLSPQYFFYRLATLGGDVFSRFHAREALYGGTHDVHGISGTVALGQYVLHTGNFEDSAHCTASDNSCTVGSWLHINPRGAMLRIDCMLQRSTVQINLDHVTAGSFQCLLDCNRNLAGLATTETHFASAITNNCQCGEGKNTSAFHYFGNPVHLNQLFLETFVFIFHFGHLGTL